MFNINNLINCIKKAVSPSIRLYTLGLFLSYSALFWSITYFLVINSYRLALYYNAFSMLEDFDSAMLEYFVYFMLTIFLVAFFSTVFLYSSSISNFILSPLNKHYVSILYGDKLNNKIFNIIFNYSKRDIHKLAYTFGMSIFAVVVFMTLFFIPIIQIAAPFLFLIIVAWIQGVNYIDYIADKNESFMSMVRELMKNKKFTVRVGLITNLFSLGFSFFALVYINNKFKETN